MTERNNQGALDTDQEVRCSNCGVLLAKVDANGLSICRGKLQAVIAGQFTASLVCYRCGKLNADTRNIPVPA